MCTLLALSVDRRAAVTISLGSVSAGTEAAPQAFTMIDAAASRPSTPAKPRTVGDMRLLGIPDGATVAGLICGEGSLRGRRSVNRPMVSVDRIRLGKAGPAPATVGKGSPTEPGAFG